MSVEDFIKAATKTKTRTSKRLEINIQDAFRNYAKTQGCWSLRLIILNRRGFPDVTVFCPGARVIFFEFKRTKNDKLSSNQTGIRTKLEELGFTYHKAHDFQAACDALDDFLL